MKSLGYWTIAVGAAIFLVGLFEPSNDFFDLHPITNLWVLVCGVALGLLGIGIIANALKKKREFHAGNSQSRNEEEGSTKKSYTHVAIRESLIFLFCLVLGAMATPMSSFTGKSILTLSLIFYGLGWIIRLTVRALRKAFQEA